jgi:hypothetical protein
MILGVGRGREPMQKRDLKAVVAEVDRRRRRSLVRNHVVDNYERLMRDGITDEKAPKWEKLRDGGRAPHRRPL